MSIKVNRKNLERNGNIPDDYDQEPNEHLLEPAVNLITRALQEGAVSAAHTTIGRIYDRKGFEHVGSIDNSSSPYQSPADDYYVRITARIPFWAEDNVSKELEQVEQANEEQKRAAAQAELKEAERIREQAEEALAEAQRKVEELQAK